MRNKSDKTQINFLAKKIVVASHAECVVRNSQIANYLRSSISIFLFLFYNFSHSISASKFKVNEKIDYIMKSKRIPLIKK